MLQKSLSISRIPEDDENCTLSEKSSLKKVDVLEDTETKIDLTEIKYGEETVKCDSEVVIEMEKDLEIEIAEVKEESQVVIKIDEPEDRTNDKKDNDEDVKGPVNATSGGSPKKPGKAPTNLVPESNMPTTPVSLRSKITGQKRTGWI